MEQEVAPAVDLASRTQAENSQLWQRSFRRAIIFYMEQLISERSRAVEDYVRAIHDLAEGSGEAAVGTNSIAQRLGVTAASASGMVRRLESLDLVVLEPYRGAALTAAGTRLALSVLRRHRLLETFLAVRLGMPWDEVHAEAEVLEHVVSQALEAAIARDLGDPLRDPHGAPIPRADGSIEPDQTVPLLELADGARAKFVRIPDERPDMLRWLAERQIAPGGELTVIGRDPFGGPLSVNIAGAEHSLGAELAAAMRVEQM
jgi:DtxR family Mn-dependent transcriptional regulator